MFGFNSLINIYLSVFELIDRNQSIQTADRTINEESRMEVYTDTLTDILPITGSASCVQSFDDSLVVRIA